jgi:hypothetical protein
MEEPRALQRVEVRQARERAIAALTEAFTRDDLEMDELESRLSKAHSASTLEELAVLVSDLKPATDAIAERAPERTIAASEVRESQTVVAIMGGAEQRGAWTCARKLRAVAFMGGTVLDFREARLPAGVVELEIFAVMGGVEVIVPPDLAVETSGSGVMGGFDHYSSSPVSASPDRPVLRISGLALMGGVEIESRLPGESGREARRREKEQRRALKSGS